MPIVELTPSAIEVEKLVIYDYDEKKLAAGQRIESIPIREPSTVVDIVFNGILASDGIHVHESYGHSIGFKFSDAKDLETVQNLFKVFDTLPLDDWQEQTFLKKDTIWFKLKMDKKNEYVFTSNLKLKAKKPTDANLVHGESITIVANPRAYFNHESKAYGISFTVKRFFASQ